MRDTGGNKKHKYLTKPHRKDLSKNTLSETDPDAKDVKKDPDLKISNRLVNYDRHPIDKYAFMQIYEMYQAENYKKGKFMDYCQIYENELTKKNILNDILSIIKRDFPNYFDNNKEYICIKDDKNKQNLWIIDADDPEISYFYLNRIN